MCGIVGTYYFKNRNTDKEYIEWCIKTMKHRGPDSNGIWQHNNYSTGFVRLAIQDISESGNQPMLSNCGNYAITFNGEIYNAFDYKPMLEEKGVVFKSTGDTEIVLYSLIHFGLDFVLQNFDGMYAFAFYNSLTEELIIARDRLGIKPLYVGYNKDESIIFSSQYDHIINYQSIRNEAIDNAVLSNYFQLGFIPDGKAIIANTELLPHGYYMHINKTGAVKHQYFKVYRSTTAIEKLLEADVLNAAKTQQISDVPLGTFLSGGVDSSYLTLLTNQVKPVTAYTISTDDVATDERERAEWFAAKFNIPHKVTEISGKEIELMINEHINAYTEPFADFSSLPSLLVSKQARKNVTVILSGDGPDELFFGYHRNVKMLSTIKKFLRNKAINTIDYLASKLSITPKIITKELLNAKTFADYYYNTMFIYGSRIWAKKICKNFAPNKAFFCDKISNDFVKEENTDEAINTIWNFEMNIHLQRILIKMDRASMYQSLEVRVPYLNNNILDKAMNCDWHECIENGLGKSNVKKLLSNYTGEDFVNASKKGFDVPMSSWVRTDLYKKMENTFLNMPNELNNLINANTLMQMLNKHNRNEENNGNMLWASFALIEWYKTHRFSYKTN